LPAAVDLPLTDALPEIERTATEGRAVALLSMVLIVECGEGREDYSELKNENEGVSQKCVWTGARGL
jgi:hypothetical protein